MNVTIIETGETATLKIIDPKSGTDWTNDLLGNHGALPDYNDETDSYHMPHDDYNWWSDLIDRYQTADDRYHELLRSLPESAYVELQEAAFGIGCDLENFPESLQAICDEFDNDED